MIAAELSRLICAVPVNCTTLPGPVPARRCCPVESQRSTLNSGAELPTVRYDAALLAAPVAADGGPTGRPVDERPAGGGHRGDAGYAPTDRTA
jgi:hypothetical protein